MKADFSHGDVGPSYDRWQNASAGFCFKNKAGN